MSRRGGVRKWVLEYAPQVIEIGEVVSTRIILNRLIDTHGVGHSLLPLNVTALGNLMRACGNIEGIPQSNGGKHWRRVE